MLRLTWYTGAAVILLSIILLAVNPRRAEKLPAGFFTPVVAFEFIQSRAEVLDLFGHETTPARSRLIHDMDLGTYIDFAYMAAYTIFLLLFTFTFIKRKGSLYFLLPAAICLAVLTGDFMENIMLLVITWGMDGDITPFLLMLRFFTWLKWGGLCVVFLCFIPALWRCGKLGRAICAAAVSASLLASASYIHRSLLNELFVLSVAFCFLSLIVFSGAMYRISKH